MFPPSLAKLLAAALCLLTSAIHAPTAATSEAAGAAFADPPQPSRRDGNASEHQVAHCSTQLGGSPRPRARRQTHVQLRCRRCSQEEASPARLTAARRPAPADRQQPSHPKQCPNFGASLGQPARRSSRQPEAVPSASSPPASTNKYNAAPESSAPSTQILRKQRPETRII